VALYLPTEPCGHWLVGPLPGCKDRLDRIGRGERLGGLEVSIKADVSASRVM
jgi:hypothetical protein